MDLVNDICDFMIPISDKSNKTIFREFIKKLEVLQ